jgi:hypothetical protein
MRYMHWWNTVEAKLGPLPIKVSPLHASMHAYTHANALYFLAISYRCFKLAPLNLAHILPLDIGNVLEEVKKMQIPLL